MFLLPEQATGHIVALQKTDPRHLDGSVTRIAGKKAQTGSFGRLFAQALSNVNDLQLNSMDLSQRMITEPESVNIEDVTIALAEANLSLSMTKAIADGAIRAYREIISIR